MISPDNVYKTSAQVAISDIVFRELFGSIWFNNGYIIHSAEDYSWALLYKDFILQALSDWANQDHINIKKKDRDFIINSVYPWLYKPSPFNDPPLVEETKCKLKAKDNRVRLATRNKYIIKELDSKIKGFIARLDEPDPFDFNTCCNILGLKPEEARDKFDLYRSLKQQHGHSIRIVSYTGSKKDLTIPTENDIIKASEKSGGQLELSMFLHTGITRKLRDDILLRKKISVKG